MLHFVILFSKITFEVLLNLLEVQCVKSDQFCPYDAWNEQGKEKRNLELLEYKLNACLYLKI